MESVVLEDSPLAAYLEGRGEAELEDDNNNNNSDAKYSNDRNKSNDKTTNLLARTALSFAPRPISNFISILPRPHRKILGKGGLLTRLRTAYALAVSSTLGSEDNERFLEHFRYIIIASQLLNEHIGGTGVTKPEQDKYSPFGPAESRHGLSKTTLTGAFVTAGAAFLLVWLLHWARGSQEQTLGGLKKRRIALVLLLFTAAGVVLYAYARRQWLQYLRRHAVEASSAFVNSLHTFETSTNSVITLIQEVELVSRGYCLSQPLPPVTRLEGKSQSRRCTRLRRNVQNIYSTAIPSFMNATENLGAVRSQDDFERFLDVYDIQSTDIEEAARGYTELDAAEAETLRQIRVHQYRLSTLRRILCCSLLSVPATGRKYDAFRWKTVVHQMEELSKILDKLSQDVSKLLAEEEKLPINGQAPARLTIPSANSPSPFNSISPNSSNVAAYTGFKSQLFRINSLSSNIRSLQAKLFLLREDSTRALANSTSETDMAQLSTTFKEQYSAIGADLADLMSIWQAGQAALQDDISRHERRLSLSSTNSPIDFPDRRSSSSLGGLTVVDEDSALGSGVVTSNTIGPMSPRSAALCALTGKSGDSIDDIAAAIAGTDSPTKLGVRKRNTVDGSPAANSYEVFEAVSAPPQRSRSTLSREQRIARQVEERERAAVMKDRRDASSNMIKELRAVINLRPESVRVERRTRSSTASSTASLSGSATSIPSTNVSSVPCITVPSPTSVAATAVNSTT